MVRLSRVAAIFAAFSIAICAVTWEAVPALAQEPAPALSPEEQVDAVFARFDSTRGPGCAVSVSRDGAVVFKQGYGMANLDHDVPIRTDTVFHVASVSKEFTAAAIALLALEGALSLDDPIQQHLPWVPQFEHPITIRHLVHHTSGMRDQWSLLGMSGWRYSEDRITNDDVVYLIGMQRDLNFVPGDRYLYSNTGYTLMGLIVEAVSGQSLREFTTKRIFEPLGMTRTHFRDDFSEIVKGQAYGYRRDDETSTFSLSVTNFDTVGATSLLTTVEDMGTWDRHFIDPIVGGQAFLELIHQPGELNNGEVQDYAFGLTLGTYRGLRTVGHGGSDAGYRSHFVRFPDHGHSVVVLCNLAQADPARLARDVADIYLEEQLEPVPEESEADVVPVTESEASRIEGAYWSASMGTALRIARDEGDLQARVGRQSHAMVHTGDGLFRVPGLGAVARFEPAEGAVDRMVFWPPGEDEAAESADRLPPFGVDGDGDEAGLQEYAGEYVSPELPVSYHIELNQDRLTVRWLKNEPSELTPVARDLLIGDRIGSLRFQRGPDGEISGLILDAGRVRNFRFERAR